MAAEAARFGVDLKKNFTKSDRAGWTAKEKGMWKAQVQLGGEKKATKFMRKYFEKKDGGGGDDSSQPKPPPKAAKAAPVLKKRDSEPEAAAGRLLCAGSLDWITLGSSSQKASPTAQNNLWGFHRIPTPTLVKLVVSGPSARHFVAVDVTGNAWSWGRNCSGQLGTGDEEPRPLPARIDGLQRPVTAAACGRHHTLAVAAGELYSFGANNAGQLGHGTVSKFANTPGKVKNSLLKSVPIAAVSCGAEFSVACTKIGTVASWGHPQYGQLGHGTNGEYIRTQGVDYSFVTKPKFIEGFGNADIRVVDVACGNHHTVARTDTGLVVSAHTHHRWAPSILDTNIVWCRIFRASSRGALVDTGGSVIEQPRTSFFRDRSSSSTEVIALAPGP